nr:hypothetical protein B2O8.270 [imported] - Neurospora crassa [Neurospora crassa]
MLLIVPPSGKPSRFAGRLSTMYRSGSFFKSASSTIYSVSSTTVLPMTACPNSPPQLAPPLPIRQIGARGVRRVGCTRGDSDCHSDSGDSHSAARPVTNELVPPRQGVQVAA